MLQYIKVRKCSYRKTSIKIVTIIPGGQKPKIIGTVCNMEVNLLPHSGDNNGLCKTKTKARIFWSCSLW